MELRKCPSCHDTVGAGSDICPRCGASYRGVMMKRVVLWLALAAAGVWGVGHYVMGVV